MRHSPVHASPRSFSLRLSAVFTAWLLALSTLAAPPEPSIPISTAPPHSSAAISLPAPSSAVELSEEDGPADQSKDVLRCGRSSQEEPETSSTTRKAADWGEITIAQPKVWQYERVNSLLDGLLRDVEGVSLADLTQLNPSASNAAALRFIQSALEVGVQYDQAGAVNARNLLQNWQAQHGAQVQQLDQYNSYMKTLVDRRDALTKQLFTAQDTVQKLQPLADAKTITAGQQQQLTVAQSQVTTIKSELDDVNKSISNAGSAPSLTSPPTLQGTSVQAPASGSTMSSTLSSFGDVIKSLPQGVQDSLNSALKSPSYPATKQLDNFITVLYERLAREISVLQDDLTRDPQNLAYLVQFDVGLYPSAKTKNHMARVEFDLQNCPGCKVYSIYPGQSSYNVTNYQGSSRRKTLWGNAATLIGLGISASYRRQEDVLRGSLVQSVYISGFQEGAVDVKKDVKADPAYAGQRFGWYYNAAPFDQYITPGIRSTFAIITVPRKLAEGEGNMYGTCLPFQIQSDWPKRDNPFHQKSHWYVPETYLGRNDGQDYPRSVQSRVIAVKLPATEYLEALPNVMKFERNKLHVLRMEYNTVYHTTPEAPSPPADTLTACLKGQCAAVLLELDVPIDPNLLVTVSGRPLQRVRDWRGRATSILPPVQSSSDLPPQSPSGAGSAQTSSLKTQNPVSRSLLEADQFGPNTWFPVTSHEILLNISRDLAGEEDFPVIQVSDPAKKTLVVPNDLDQGFSEIICNGFRLTPRTSDQLIRSIRARFQITDANYRPPDTSLAVQSSGPYASTTFLPLFLPDPPVEHFYAFIGETGEELLIAFLGDATTDAKARSQKSHRWLDSRSQVVLEDRDLDLAWSLSCSPQGPELVCKIPGGQIEADYEYYNTLCTPRSTCSALSSYWEDYPFISTLQVWIEQYDPEGANSFYSSAPASLGLFPVGAKGFISWRFSEVVSDAAKDLRIEGCGYSREPGAGSKGLAAVDKITVLGALRGLERNLRATRPDCLSFDIPSLQLSKPEIVIQLSKPEIVTTAPRKKLQAAMAVPTALLRPHLGKAQVTPVAASAKAGQATHNTAFHIERWSVDFPVLRVDCDDTPSFAPNLPAKNVTWEWRLGGNAGQDCNNLLKLLKGSADARKTWFAASRDGGIILHLEILKDAFRSLGTDVYLLRGSDKISVATLPNLQKLLLPSKLTVQPLSDSQFALRGNNSNAIDYVSLSDGKTTWLYPASAGVDFALVTIDKDKSGSANKKTKTSKTGGGKQQPAKDPGKAPGPGLYTVLPLIQVDGGILKPIDVTSDQDKPLTFTIPGPAKKDTSNGNGETTITKITKTVQTTKPSGAANSAAATGNKQKKQE